MFAQAQEQLHAIYSFPIQEDGVNHEAQRLQKHEITAMKSDTAIMRRLLRSYTMMLDFYGMQLVSEDTGELQRTENWKERYRNLSRKSRL